MKKLILLLLFIPLMSFGQGKILESKSLDYNLIDSDGEFTSQIEFVDFGYKRFWRSKDTKKRIAHEYNDDLAYSIMTISGDNKPKTIPYWSYNEQLKYGIEYSYSDGVLNRVDFPRQVLIPRLNNINSLTEKRYLSISNEGKSKLNILYFPFDISFKTNRVEGKKGQHFFKNIPIQFGSKYLITPNNSSLYRTNYSGYQDKEFLKTYPEFSLNKDFNLEFNFNIASSSIKVKNNMLSELESTIAKSKLGSSYHSYYDYYKYEGSYSYVRLDGSRPQKNVKEGYSEITRITEGTEGQISIVLGLRDDGSENRSNFIEFLAMFKDNWHQSYSVYIKKKYDGIIYYDEKIIVDGRLRRGAELRVRKKGSNIMFIINDKIVYTAKNHVFDEYSNAIEIDLPITGVFVIGYDVAKPFENAPFGLWNKTFKISLSQDIENVNKNLFKPSQWKGNGSGFFISKSGYLATNYHVIEDASEIEVEYINNQKSYKYKAEVIQTDPSNDLAILKIKDPAFNDLSSIPYNVKTRSSDVGSSVFALGFPMALSGMGKEIKFTDGKISSKTGFNGDIRTYQTTTPIQGGNSGGPLFDYKGNLVGINSAKISSSKADNVSYSIKSSYLNNLMDVLPESVSIPSDTSLSTKSLTDQIKVLSNYVVLIKVK